MISEIKYNSKIWGKLTNYFPIECRIKIIKINRGDNYSMAISI